MAKPALIACAGLALLCLHAAEAQVLSSAGAAAGQERGGMLAGQARTIHPALAARLASPVVMEADEAGSALPMQVAFEPGSARLTASATRALDHLGQALSGGPLGTDRIRVEGHADAHGRSDVNRDISERRAMAVAAYLEQNFAISPNRIECSAVGATAPRERIVVIARLTSG